MATGCGLTFNWYSGQVLIAEAEIKQGDGCTASHGGVWNTQGGNKPICYHDTIKITLMADSQSHWAYGNVVLNKTIIVDGQEVVCTPLTRLAYFETGERYNEWSLSGSCGTPGTCNGSLTLHKLTGS